MKIALFSDIHANLPALKACFKSLDQQKPDFVYCLGDLVGYNIWPNEVINEIRQRNIPTIAGNYDQGVGIAGDDCGCAYKTDHDKSNGEQSIAYTNSVVKSLKIMLQRVPETVNLPEIKQKILCLDQVKDLSHLHVWSLTEEKAVVTVHVLVTGIRSLDDASKVKQQIRSVF